MHAWLRFTVGRVGTPARVCRSYGRSANPARSIKEALRWKLAYIAAFNRMEAELQKPAQDPQRIQLAQRLATCSTWATTAKASPACPMPSL
ncbi:Rha family transcriptional regulator [Comamonas thiooxydans]|uniref:Rha family transcriptional regulator n=1 Tax=Comamonas thiooxydans TaxID=363952 RepID=UPI002115600A|nr:Rha family transcriptional regulator [Comamonas thiooxydans]UUE94305.1 Rha family transcriptional regulator [Comamonas thiooxydans]